MTWGQLQIGALVLKETDIVQDATNASTGSRTVRVEGRETHPGATHDQVMAKHEDIMSLYDRVFALQFERKPLYDGYYRIADTNAELEQWAEQPVQSRWSLALDLIGPENAVDIESRLANVVRGNDFGLSGERWHAPALGHYGYHLGANPPAWITRTGQDGGIRVYRSLPAGSLPRWGSKVANFGGGRVRLELDGIERIGAGIQASPTGWTVSNGLVRVDWSGGLRVAAWSGGAWRNKVWNVNVSSTVTVTMFDEMTVLRNDNEAVVARLVYSVATGGRALLDLTLRRGSRIVEGYLQTAVSANELRVNLATLEANTNNSASGYVVATANDADGNRFVAGSARSFTAHANGGLVRPATRTLDFFLGAVVGGGAAQAGDDAVSLRNQYIGVMSERTGVAVR